MRFSVWPAPTQSFPEMLQIAQHAENTGWDGLWLADHFMPDGEETSAPWPEAWTTLSALAASVPRVRIGTLVTGNTYRHPAVLAKMAATVDHLSGGRVVLGLGAGWQQNEHEQYGIHYGTIPERLARLDEACQVIKALYTEKSASFEGRHYQLTNASLEPKPLGPLPLLVGGGGEKVTLRITAQWADEWNVWGNVETLERKNGILDGHCEKLGRDPKAIQRSAVALLFLSEDEAFLSGMRGRDIGRPTIVGTASEVADIVRAYRDAGVDELIVPDFTLGAMPQKLETLDRFIEGVAPALR